MSRGVMLSALDSMKERHEVRSDARHESVEAGEVRCDAIDAPRQKRCTRVAHTCGWGRRAAAEAIGGCATPRHATCSAPLDSGREAGARVELPFAIRRTTCPPDKERQLSGSSSSSRVDRGPSAGPVKQPVGNTLRTAPKRRRCHELPPRPGHVSHLIPWSLARQHHVQEHSQAPTVGRQPVLGRLAVARLVEPHRDLGRHIGWRATISLRISRRKRVARARCEGGCSGAETRRRGMSHSTNASHGTSKG